MHFTAQFPGLVFLLLWGMPFLVENQGTSRTAAENLLTLSVLVNMALGPALRSRHRPPTARLPLALGTIAANAALWAVVTGWPGNRVPGWLLVTLCIVLGACGPAALVGFDFARPVTRPEDQGTVSGIVNMGGFTAAIGALLVIGALLDATDDDFRIAFAPVLALQAFGVWRILRTSQRLRRAQEPLLRGQRVPAADGG